MKIIKILIIIIIILLVILLSKTITNKDKKNNEINKTNIINNIETNNININKKVEIISHTKNTFSIDVIIKNNTNKNLKEVIVKAECYDKEGNNLGTQSNGRYNVNTKDKYKITIYCDSDTYKYNLKVEYK